MYVPGATLVRVINDDRVGVAPSLSSHSMLGSVHALVKEKDGRRLLKDIKLMKDDPAAVEKQAEDIKARYTKYFKV